MTIEMETRCPSYFNFSLCMNIYYIRPKQNKKKVEIKSDMNHDQEISIPQSPIRRTRAKKLQQTVYTYIQAMVSSSKRNFRRRWRPPLYIVQS